VLRTQAHFARFAGERVKVEMMQPVNGRKRFQGRLQKVEESEITLELESGTVSLPIDDIHRARLVPEV
jgi:ribosome maturation factor RimP